MKEESKDKNVTILTIIAMMIFYIFNCVYNILIEEIIFFTASLSGNCFAIFFSLITYIFLWGITKKASKATLISFIIIWILNLANILKLSYTDEPIYFSDVSFLRNIEDLIKIVKSGNAVNFVKIFVFFSAYAIILGIIYIYHKKYDLDIENKKARIVMVIIPVIIIFTLFFPNKYKNIFFRNCIENEENYRDYSCGASYKKKYVYRGAILGMYQNYLDNFLYEPENYNEDIAKKILEENNVKDKENKLLGKPNIIIISSEAFFDIDRLEEIKFNKKISENYIKLQSKGKKIELVSASYGGMSENPAFEMLTGSKLNYFPLGYIPITNLYKRKNSSEAPSLIKELKKNGYYSEIIFGKDYYYSEDAYKKIGFDNYYDMNLETYAGMEGEIYTYLINELNNKEKGKKVLYFIETIEGHMPYLEENYTTYDIKLEESNLNEEENKTLISYAQAVHNADKELGRLYDYINNYDEPTIIIYYGDHLPYLYSRSGNNVISNLEYFNQGNLEDWYRLYNTSALIIANFNIDSLEVPECLGNDHLLNVITNNMDIELGSYYKYLYKIMKTFPGYNRYIGVDNNNNIVNVNSLNTELQEIYDIRNILQYYLFVK